MEKSCIYCGTNNSLSKSDIIPDSLTAKKIINNCVCPIAHNSKFSDEFESEVIQKLAFITNELDIMSSKANSPHPYDADFFINGQLFTDKTYGNRNFNSEKTVKSADGAVLMGPMEKIKKIKNGDNLIEVDLNRAEIVKRVNFDIDVFYSRKMFRLIAKIAFEWYAKENRLCCPHVDFEAITNFIISGEGESPVGLVDDYTLYEMIRGYQIFGSHLLYMYINEDKEVCVLISFFGIAIYQVVVTKNFRGTRNCCLQELRINATETSFRCEDFNYLTEKSNHILLLAHTPTSNANIELHFLNFEEFRNYNIRDFMYFLNQHLQTISGEKKMVSEPSEQLDILIKQGLNAIDRCFLIHIRGLRRYAKDNISLNNENPFLYDHWDGKDALYCFSLFRIGLGILTDLTDTGLNNFVASLFEERNNEVVEGIVMIKNLIQEIKRNPDNAELIRKGAEIVLASNI